MTENAAYDKDWEAFRSGSKAAFAEIYKTYATLLLGYGGRICGDPALVEDSVHDLFVELWRSRQQVSSTDSVKFYLFKALRYKINRNKDSNHSGVKEPIEDYMYILKDNSYEEHFIQIEAEAWQIAVLKDAIENLPPRQQEVINLRYFHNFSNDEIAGITGINYQSACKSIYAALKALREILESNNRGRKAN